MKCICVLPYTWVMRSIKEVRFVRNGGWLRCDGEEREPDLCRLRADMVESRCRNDSGQWKKPKELCSLKMMRRDLRIVF